MERMYDDLAAHWLRVSPVEGYAEEAVHWRAVLEAHLGPPPWRLLELGVGGANNLSHLAPGNHVVGVDRSAGMLEHARRLLTEAEFHVGDMRSVRLGETFDAVLIHDAVTYLTSEDDLWVTFETAALHLRPGGILICAPDHFTESFAEYAGVIRAPQDHGDGFALFEYVHDPDPTDTTVDVLYTFHVPDADGVLRTIQDRHTLGLFPRATWERLIGEAGLVAGTAPYPVHDDGREAYLFTGAKPGV